MEYQFFPCLLRDHENRISWQHLRDAGQEEENERAVHQKNINLLLKVTLLMSQWE